MGTWVGTSSFRVRIPCGSPGDTGRLLREGKDLVGIVVVARVGTVWVWHRQWSDGTSTLTLFVWDYVLCMRTRQG